MQKNKVVPLEGIPVTVFKHVMLKTKRMTQTRTSSGGYYTVSYDYEEKKEGEPLCLLIFVGNLKKPLAIETKYDPEIVEEVDFFV